MGASGRSDRALSAARTFQLIRLLHRFQLVRRAQHLFPPIHGASATQHAIQELGDATPPLALLMPKCLVPLSQKLRECVRDHVRPLRTCAIRSCMNKLGRNIADSI